MVKREGECRELPVRILIVDDHAIVRKGLRALLVTEPGVEVVGEAENGEQAVAEARRLCPDVVLMDLVMPGMDGLEATRRITAAQPQAPSTPRVLVLTSFAADDKVFPALRAGALGYLLKDSGPEELVQAIRQVHRGESSLHPSIARRLAPSIRSIKSSPAASGYCAKISSLAPKALSASR